MNIVMLGHSGAGKTTYVSLMYEEMYKGISGFRVQAKDDAHHRQLLRDAQSIRCGRYPSGTSRRTSYELALSYNSAEVLPFRWSDHRGGAMTDRRRGDPDVTALHDDLVASDGIVLFADACELAVNPRAGGEVRKLTSHVLRAFRVREEVLTPLVIVLTKTDLIDLDDEKIADNVTSPFADLVEAVAATRHIYGTFLGVSCGPEPENVIAPALWALRFGLAGRSMRMARTAQQFEEQASRAAAMDTLTDRISSYFKKEPTWAQIARQRQAAAEAERARLEPLLVAVRELDEGLEGISSF